MAACCKIFNYSKLFISRSTCRSQGVCSKKISQTQLRFLHNRKEPFSKFVDNRRKRIAIGATVLGVSGALGFYYTAKVSRVIADVGKRPVYEPIRRIRNPADKSGLKLTLYQYQTCPFCCKVRAYLDYYGFSYDVIEVNSVWRTELKWTKYPKVPVLVCDLSDEEYVQINDSSVIISILHSYLEEGQKASPELLKKLISYYPGFETKNDRGKTVYNYPNKYYIMYGERDVKTLSKSEYERSEEFKWRQWVDSWLVHTLSPNVYRTPREALQAFEYFSEVGEWNKVFNTVERITVIYVGAIAMYFVGKILKKRYSLNDDVRQSLYDAAEEWISAIGKDRKFMGGNQPNLADLAVYGSLSSIEGCQAFHETKQHTDIEQWFSRMKKLVNQQAGQEKIAEFEENHRKNNKKLHFF